ncbi:hypothetical protein KC660_00775 [Candidatus Dojkabacteria bacterium]|uniref:Uncharacterized protein n=1 Tax=Candidatus Dojkabacteria bacterium TaxID=2099670 RepID=A0A955L302_9BACT|nr:hypothetical protein [Candidatus Dojkabacteria bacterium]
MSKTNNNKDYGEVRPLIENNPVSKKYFFDNIDEEWFSTLQENKVFQPDISISDVTDDGYYQDWVEGRYLVRISKVLPQEVYDVIVGIELEDHTNPLIYEIVTEIIANVADKVDVESMINIIIKDRWIGKKGRVTFMYFKIKDIFTKLISMKNYDLLNTFLETILSFDLPADYLEDSKKRFIDPIPLIELYSLQEIMQDVASICFEHTTDLNKILDTLVTSFDKYLDLSRDTKAYVNNDIHEDYSFIWKPAIEYDKDRLYDIKEDFVVTIRDLLIHNLEIIDSKSFGLLSKSKKRIFQRIKLHIYSKAAISEDIAVKEIIDNIDDRHNVHELRALLMSKFHTFTEESKSNILKIIKESFSDVSLDNEQKNRYKTELIKPLKEHLSKKQKEEYKEFIQSEHGYVPSYRSNGMRSGPNSRYSREQLLEKSHQELVEVFIDEQKLFEKHPHNEDMYSPRGVRRLWQSIVAENFEDYQDNLHEYDPSKILPLYINHLINGLEEVTNKDIQVKWNKILIYVGYLLDLYEQDRFIESQVKEPFDVGSKDEVFISILRLLENGFKGKKLMPISLKDKVWKILVKIFSIINDIDESFVENNDKDYFTYSINSIGGLILHNAYYYGFWVINKKGLKKYPKEFTEFISEFIDTHLNYKTGASVMGHFLPWTHHYSTKLFSKQKTKLLPIKDKDVRYVAWETYLANTIFEKPYQELRDIYIQSIKELDQEIPQRRYWAEPKNTLLEHIMVGYIHKFDNTEHKEPLFHLLLETGSIKHIAYAIDFVGRAYASSDNEAKKNLPKDKLQRIKKIWQMVLDNCNDPEIFENFGWWIKKDYYGDNEWLLDMLLKTLEKSGGNIDPDFRVLEQLSLLAPEFPLLVAKILDRMVKSVKKEKTYYFRDKEVSSIIEQLELEDNDDVNTFVKDIRETLVEYGYPQYAK